MLLFVSHHYFSCAQHTIHALFRPFSCVSAVFLSLIWTDFINHIYFHQASLLSIIFNQTIIKSNESTHVFLEGLHLIISILIRPYFF